MNKNIATKLLHVQYIQIDLIFKHVQGKINEFEFNEFDLDYNITVIEIVNKLCKQNIQIKHIHNDSWGVILGNLNIAQTKGLGLVLVDLDSTKA
ncbi:hypothetical protein C2G38_2229321 [Gigaspora rosea]|uniref:Uncharacterized protein n=1 Tax=Gigaspora rosea TaxID=44941 RepID=A0A397U4B8_9GLOM|nr:hypothetical protein C2G38_2229321 [Gigaspora rosea]